MHLVQLDSWTRDYNGTRYTILMLSFQTVKIKGTRNMFVNKSLGRWRSLIFNFLGGPFLPLQPPPTNIYKMPAARQRGDTNVTYYFTCHHCHLPHREIEKHHCTYTSFSNKLWSRFSSISCIHMRMNVYCWYDSMTYAGLWPSLVLLDSHLIIFARLCKILM